MKRGDVVTIADGKPRPAIVVQADEIVTPFEVLVCPLTTTLLDVPFYRPTIEPTAVNRLNQTSQMMTDKTGPVSKTRIGGAIGRLDEADLLRLEIALAVVLGLGR